MKKLVFIFAMPFMVLASLAKADIRDDINRCVSSDSVCVSEQLILEIADASNKYEIRFIASEMRRDCSSYDARCTGIYVAKAFYKAWRNDRDWDRPAPPAPRPGPGPRPGPRPGPQPGPGGYDYCERQGGKKTWVVELANVNWSRGGYEANTCYGTAARKACIYNGNVYEEIFRRDESRQISFSSGAFQSTNPSRDRWYRANRAPYLCQQMADELNLGIVWR